MSKMLLLIFVLLLPAFASKITKHIIDEKEGSVDIMLTFDSPYHGKIVQKKDTQSTILILEDMDIDTHIKKEIQSPIVQELQLLPYQSTLLIKLTSQEDFQVDASKTVDLYGLRLRIKPQMLASLESMVLEEEITKIETKKDDGVEGAYLKMMLVLLALMAGLYFLKRWMDRKGQGIQGNWLFNKADTKTQNDIKILQQRPLDVKNRIAVVGYGEKEYLLLLGNNNVLLDSFETKDSHHDNDFDSVLSQNQEALSDFIDKKRVDAYKEKLSQD